MNGREIRERLHNGQRVYGTMIVSESPRRRQLDERPMPSHTSALALSSLSRKMRMGSLQCTVPFRCIGWRFSITLRNCCVGSSWERAFLRG